MKKTIWTIGCSAIIGVVSVAMAGQTASPAPSQASSPAPSQKSTEGADNQITVTGCLKAAPTSADSGAKFVLTNASASPAAADSTSAASASTPAKTYRLVANPAALSPHVGKKLELTGTIDNQSSASSSGSSASGTAASAAAGPALVVKAGKVIAPSCTE
jgi:hypothetical protein